MNSGLKVLNLKLDTVIHWKITSGDYSPHWNSLSLLAFNTLCLWFPINSPIVGAENWTVAPGNTRRRLRHDGHSALRTEDSDSGRAGRTVEMRLKINVIKGQINPVIRPNGVYLGWEKIWECKRHAAKFETWSECFKSKWLCVRFVTPSARWQTYNNIWTLFLD